jgi:cold shock CspA family protein
MSAAVPSFELHRGRVSSFDRRRGLGVVTDEGGQDFEFHATAIADGSRTIDPGAAVNFLLTPGHRGRYEARGLTPLDPSAGG